MKWFKQGRGVDLQVLKRTKYWDAIETLVDTDKQTHSKIVQYIYEQVSDSIVEEFERMEKEADKMTVMQDARNYLANRIKLLKGYKEMVYKAENKDG